MVIVQFQSAIAEFFENNSDELADLHDETKKKPREDTDDLISSKEPSQKKFKNAEGNKIVFLFHILFYCVTPVNHINFLMNIF